MDRTPFTSKVQRLEALGPDALAALNSLKMNVASIRRRTHVVAEQTQPAGMYVILAGWAARYSLRASGSRRITGFLLPGDFCGIHAACGVRMDHSIVAITDCEVGVIDSEAAKDLVRTHPKVGDAIWKAKVIQEASLRRWLLASDDAQRALAHLFCEFAERSAQIDERTHDDFEMPTTQEDIGDALGMTAVHVNRTIRRLREMGLIERVGSRLRILDRVELVRVAQFCASYLQAESRAYSKSY